jgi:hypothetical protein
VLYGCGVTHADRALQACHPSAIMTCWCWCCCVDDCEYCLQHMTVPAPAGMFGLLGHTGLMAMLSISGLLSQASSRTWLCALLCQAVSVSSYESVSKSDADTDKLAAALLVAPWLSVCTSSALIAAIEH